MTTSTVDETLCFGECVHVCKRERENEKEFFKDDVEELLLDEQLFSFIAVFLIWVNGLVCVWLTELRLFEFRSRFH